jgi:hypothetical protein
MTTGKSLEEIADFNDWLGGQPHPHKIVVAGNHDLLFEKALDKAREQLTNAVYLENSGIGLGGVTFWGSPITPVLPNWAFHVERGAASRRYWDRIPLGTDVVITHGPPYGTLDKRHILGSRFGCKDLIQAVSQVKPKPSPSSMALGDVSHRHCEPDSQLVARTEPSPRRLRPTR